MSKADLYYQKLQSLKDWQPYLLAESGLPGPRGNLELAHIVADLGDRALFERYLEYDAQKAPVNSPYEFLAFCGALGLGRLLAEGHTDVLPQLRACAADPRWRMREAVAQGLQRLGAVDMPQLLAEMQTWSRGTPLEQRAAVAALCEPAQLTQPAEVQAVLQILDHITATIPTNPDRKHPDFIALRKGLAYCWSVAVCALPGEGKPLMEKWFHTEDKDIRWIMKENLKKKRLSRMDEGWVNKLVLVQNTPKSD